MKKDIDCLLIGHNEIEFEEYENVAVKMGLNSGAYRDLNLNYISWNNKPYTAAGIFNLFNGSEGKWKPLKKVETFSAAIAYLGSYLDGNGLNFEYVNSFQDDKEHLARILAQDNILTIAIITTLYVFALPILEIIDFIKKYNRTAKIIVGGPFVATKIRTQSDSALEYLFKEAIRADFFVNSSQGEKTLVKIIHALKNSIPPEQIENIYYINGNRFGVTPVLKEDNKLSENPVNWQLFSQRTGEHVNVRTSVSCPFSCSFCGFPEHAGKYQTMDVDNIERELNRLNEISAVKSLNIIDDTFNVPVKRFKKILRMMIKNKYRFKWHSYFRCQYADREMVELMKESGCEGVFLGIESGNEQILKNMNKASSLEKYREGIALLKECGIVTFGSFITGFPGETSGTAGDTVEFIKESGLDFYRTQLWYCEPITPIWNEREKYKIKGESFEWTHSSMDSKSACNIIDDMFLSIEDPIWIPQYNFDFDSIWHLIHRGMSLAEVKHFLRIFNRGVKEKLLNLGQKEVSYEVIKELKGIFRETANAGPDDDPGEEEINVVDKYDAGFDF